MLPMIVRKPFTKFRVIVQYRVILLLLNRQYYSTITSLGRRCVVPRIIIYLLVAYKTYIMTFFLSYVMSNLTQFT
jgi:hypothetical protein